MKTYIIAEVGPNHNGSRETAINMIEKLADIGVDAVKFQLCIPEDTYSLDAFKARYQKENEGSPSPLEMSKKYQLSFEDHRLLYKASKQNNVDYLCSAFDIKSLIFLDRNFDMPYFKIASGEIFTVDILEYISRSTRPIIISTGMAEYSEIEKAINILNKNSKKEMILLHCVSKYPALCEDVNLNVIPELKKRFGYPVGFSDHTTGNECAIAAVAIGACMIEKHVTLDKNMSGPDHKASVTVEEFIGLVKAIRNIEKAMGTKDKIFSSSELEIKKAARKSIVSKRVLMPGKIIGEEDICYKRPGIGFLPTEKNLIIGMKVKNRIEADSVIRKEDLEWQSK